MIIQVLRVSHYGETPKEDRRITISPHEITAMAVNTEVVETQGRKLLSVSVMMKEGPDFDLVISHSDVEKLEAAIGSYILPSDEDQY